ncbi:MAG: HAD family hydrolase [Fimbriimonas sp.]
MKAVLFDLDNTLHDRDAGVVSFLHAQHAARRLDKHGIPLQTWMDRFVALDQSGRVWKDVVYGQLCEEMRLPIDAASLLAEYEADFSRHVHAHAGLEETLDFLRAEGWRTGVVTNGRSEFQRRTLAALKIEPRLDLFLISAECGHRKPDPAIFRLALETLGCEAEASWFVGDDPVADVEGAARAGMRALWFRPSQRGENTVTHLLEVLEAVRRP